MLLKLSALALVSICFLQADPDVPKRIRAGSDEQAAKLIHKPETVYPPSALEARIQGTVRFDVVIGTDGKVVSATLLSGHPLLVPSATEAVREYEYRPTLLNGEPVEVAAEVPVVFVLPQ